MSAALEELYQEVILDHHRRPRNLRPLGGAARRAEGYNPLCGDRLTVYVDLDGDVIRDVSFEGDGCAISRAAASLMTVSVRGKRVAEVEALRAAYHRMVTGGAAPAAEHGAAPAAEHRIAPPADLGKLRVFAGVAAFPARVKCATLAWHTLRAALAGEGGTVSAESSEDER